MTQVPANLKTAIERVRRTYHDLSRQLEHSGPPGIEIPELISSSEEFGIEAALEGMAKSPPREFKATLESLIEAGDELDLLVATREKILRSDDPTRSTVFAVQGHDVAIDDQAGLTIEVVEPRAAPDAKRIRELELSTAGPSKAKTKRRDRSR